MSKYDELLCLAGVKRRTDYGVPAHPMPDLCKRQVIESVCPKSKAVWDAREALQEGRLTAYADAKKMKEGLERANSLVQRALATIQGDGARYRSPGMMSEKLRADMFRADQELATALESIAAAVDALQAVEEGKKQNRRRK